MARLEDELVQALARHRAADPRRALALVTPSRVLGLHLRRRVAVALSGIANLHVLTLPDLARRVAAEPLAAAGWRPLPPSGERLLVEGALRASIPSRDGYFTAVAGLRNFPAALRRTLLDLKRAAVTPDRLVATLGGGAAGAKIRELGDCYRAVEETLAAHRFYDTSDLLVEAARLVESAPDVLSPPVLLVCGFVELNPLESRLLEACQRAGTVEWLRPWPGGGSLPAPEAVEIVGAPGEEREVREIARRILQHVEQGGRFDDVAILLPRPAGYRAAVRDVFASAGIPHGLAAGGALAPTLGETRAGRSLALLSEVDRSGFSRSAVLDFLAFADLRPGPGVSPAEWERLARAAGVVGGLREWRSRLERLGPRLGPPGPAASDEEEVGPDRLRDREALVALRRVIGRLGGSLGRLPDEGPLGDMIRRLVRGLRGLLRSSPELEALVAALGTLHDLESLQPRLARGELWSLVESVLAGPAPDPEDPGGDRVLVADLAAVAGLGFPLTIVAGLAEGSMPSAPRQDPILLDRERRALTGLPLSEAEPALDRTRFRLVLESGAGRVLLSYPRTDLAGRPRVPSFLLLDLVEALTGRVQDFDSLARWPGHRQVLRGPVPAGAERLPVDEREWLVTRALAARSDPAALLAGLPGATRGFAALQARERDERLTAYDGRLSSGIDPAAEPLAATWLETYAGCPFRFFVARVLRVRPVEEPERVWTLSPLARGELTHGVLEVTYRRLAEAGLLPLGEEPLTEARSILDAALDEGCATAERRGLTGLPALWEGERSRLRAELHAALVADARESEGRWTPFLLEAAFGLSWLPEAAPPLEYTLPDGTVLRLSGKIDRIDLSPDGARARVLDYKTGRLRGPVGPDRLHGGRALQLPIYRLAAAAILAAGERPAVVEEAEYRYLFGRDAGRRVRFGPAGWAARRADFDRALSLMVEGIREGRFFPWPPTCGGRGPCAYDLACGAERRRWAEAKAADSAVVRHVELESID